LAFVNHWSSHSGIVSARRRSAKPDDVVRVNAAEEGANNLCGGENSEISHSGGNVKSEVVKHWPSSRSSAATRGSYNRR